MDEQLAKYFSGESSEDEIQEINSWRNDSSDNAKWFLQAKNLWISSQPVPEPKLEVLTTILDEDPLVAKEVHMPPSSSKRWIKYAAAAVVVMAMAFVVNTLWLSANDQKFTLADGSEILLHGESVVEKININEQVREVYLTGKAYFDVERDENRPFIIVTENARIEVLGTSFLIDATNEKTEVCVESGLVSLIKPGLQGKTDLSVKLSEGEMGTVADTNRGIVKKNNDNVNYLAWKTKTLTFDRSKMSEVEEVLEDVYGIDIQFENSDLGNCNLTAKFKERKAKDAIEIIAKTFNLSFEMKDGLVILKGKGC